MALTTSNLSAAPLHPVPAEDQAFTYYTVSGDTSYSTGGSALATLFPAADITWIDVSSNGNTTRLYEWDFTNNKLLAFTRATGAQVANATDLSADTIRIRVWSRAGAGS